MVSIRSCFRSAFVGACVLVAACSNPAPPPPPAAAPAAPAPRKYLLERVDDAALVQVYADGFAALPLQEKQLLWHLYQAAVAGRDIFYDQKSAHGLEMRGVLEAIASHPGGTLGALGKIQEYTKLFWLNSGPFNNLTGQKFLLTCTPQEFANAANAARAQGAEFPTAPGESLDGLLARLQPMFFDPTVEPTVTAKSPPPGQDILTASHNNLYSGVAMKDLAAFKEQYPLNSRLVKRDGKLVEEVYRVGGRYDPEIRDVITHLTEAKAFATPTMAKAIDALIKWYQTGEAADRRAYDIAWVEDKASPADTVNGFTEVYLDARGQKGAWEGIVDYVNQDKTKDIQKLAAQAQWFEDHMPWDPKYRKSGVQGITANAIDVVIETGDSGPITPVGINLPNDQSVREQYGSKSVSLSNINEAYDKSSDPKYRAEFAWSPDEVARADKWGTLASDLLTNMHEVIGHASGKVSDSLKGKPETLLKEYFSALEEGRADLVALYFVADPKLVELGLIPQGAQGDVVNAMYANYTTNVLAQLRRVRTGTQIEEDHMRNRQMIVNWLMANTKAIEKRTRDGKTYLVVVDPKAFRDGAGKLLAEVQRIKGEGDYAAARKLFDTYGVHFDPKLRDEVVKRVDALKLPAYSGFVMPALEGVKDANGQITDVKISYPEDLTKQMLAFSAATKATRDQFLAGERGKK